ncbi:SLC13 family permease [Desulfococcus multivorans]|uniref:Anion transporter n=1 Tax=Desulfococcus multivorans DSM 2059 TaxID=1121405 RepID=S7TCE3_DESML|nr:DASS family sodium-coupled anion symporter [Desulfococcus multivorans]AOY59560.1 sodium/sulfate symporter [Desulfococcus multivorans]AQV01751.1 anion transporter [Desulfococcus multivorans]EPR34205.1 anion transporter [Desulfococcus multivorans DSM 2059]SKA20120.1 solute carrier family 13 (sodium-dependent dicarboxylate transporter), member 2/3/5 [Desulfococcus multivorans DSM 2059]
MLLKKKGFQLCMAFVLGLIVMLLPRPEGERFKITGDEDHAVLAVAGDNFTLDTTNKSLIKGYVLKKTDLEKSPKLSYRYLQETARGIDPTIEVHYVDGLPPKAHRFLAMLVTLVFLFVVEPIPLEITAVLIGVLLVALGITDVKNAWAPYMNPVVVFIMCCLIFAVSLDKAGLTRRMGYYIVKKAGTSVTRFTFIICIGLGIGSSFMHDAAACSIGLITMIPLMRAAGIDPHTNTAKFMMMSLPFACSAGGMGSLIGGGRCMASAAFLYEFTGGKFEITFLDWIKYAMPAAVITVPLVVVILYFLYRPDPKYQLPRFDDEIGPWTAMEKRTLTIIGIMFLLWLTKGFHGLDYSITGMVGVAALVVFGIMKWEDISENLEWGTALFIFGGGISMGLAMDSSGAAQFFANLVFPHIEGKGWIVLFVGMGVFGALVTNVMANVAAAAMILPIAIPMAQLEGINPIILALCLGMATSFAYLLVIGCPPNAIAYSYRYFKSSDLTKAGLVVMPILLLTLVLVAASWWKILGLV